MPSAAVPSQPAERSATKRGATSVALDVRCRLNPQVALRDEPFGALAYHYGNRRLVFLKHVDMVTVLSRLDSADTLRDALAGAGVAESRWPAFVAAISSLTASEIVCVD